MRKHTLLGVALVAALGATLTLGARWNASRELPFERVASAQEPTSPAPTLQYGPAWRVGQTWTVETVALPQASPEAFNADEETLGEPIRWRFTVDGENLLYGRKCFRATIVCQLESATKPTIQIWVDQKTKELVGVKSTTDFGDRKLTICEAYLGGPQETGALGPLTALPLDMPYFKPGFGAELKGLEATDEIEGLRFVSDEDFELDAPQTKSLSDATPTFARKIRQKATRLQTTKAIGDREYNAESMLYEVSLDGGDVQVNQIWAPNQPWPLVSENGATRATLILE